MEALRKVVRKNPLGRSGKHHKLSENWGEHKEPVKEGVTFYLKYLGSTLVEELPDGDSYGDHISAEAVKTIVAMAKASGKKLPKMSITINPGGIKVRDMLSNEVKTDLDIYRISFCTADKAHDKVFGYIARNNDNETMECHAFLCSKRKIAQAVTLTVAQAFNMAKDEWEGAEAEKSDLQKVNDEEKSESSSPKDTSHSPDVETPSKEPLVVPYPTQATMGFEDNFSDMDPFASFAQSRSRDANPFRTSQFSTNLQIEELALDDSIIQLTRGQHHTELINRTPSVDDLLSL